MYEGFCSSGLEFQNSQKGRSDLRLVSTCKYFEKTEKGESSGVFALLLNRRISCVFAVLLAYMHVLFERCIHAEPTSMVF